MERGCSAIHKGRVTGEESTVHDDDRAEKPGAWDPANILGGYQIF